MAEGYAAAVVAAFVWAVSGAVIAHQGKRIDAFSISVVRATASLLFLVPAIFVLGAQGDFSRMSAGDIAQLIGTGFMATAIAETLFAVTIPLFGLTRTFTIAQGGTVLFAYVFGLIFIGDKITVLIGLGSAVVVAGVYIIANYGRPREEPVNRAAAEPTPIAGGSVDVAEEPAGAMAGDALFGPIAAFARAHAFAVGLTLSIAMAMMWGGASVWLRSASEGFDASAAAAIRMPVVIPFLILVAGVQPRSSLRRRSIPRRSLVWLTVSGMLGTGLVVVLIVASLQRVSAGEFTVLFNTGPLFGIVLGAIFLRERITPWVVVGAALVLGGIAMVAVR